MATTSVLLDSLVQRFSEPRFEELPRLAVSFREASQMTGLSQSNLQRLAYRGEIRSTKIGARRVISLESLRELFG